MPLSIPPELKPITPFVRRAEELDKDAGRPESRLVAYYCRQYAVHQGIPLANHHGNPTVKVALGHLLEQLEGEKQAMDQFTRPEAEYLCRQFAYQIFDKADAEDRAGTATKTTAKTFYTAASFLQMLEQFYDASDDETAPSNDQTEDKKRALYSKWKATEILKAIKEGRSPQAGGYGEPTEETKDEEETKDDETPADHPEPEPMPIDDDPEEPPKHGNEVSDLPPAVAPTPPVETVDTPFADDDDKQEDEEGQEVTYGQESLPPPPSYPGAVNNNTNNNPPPPPAASTKPPLSFDLPPAVPPALPPPPKVVAPPQPAAPPKQKGGWFGNKNNKNKTANKNISKAQMADATELTQFALAALQDRNGTLAAERLQQALNVLQQQP